MDVGTHVRVHGLTKAKKLNGSFGMVVVAGGGGGGGGGGGDVRVSVRLKSGRTIHVKPANLDVVPLVGGGNGGFTARFAGTDSVFDAATCLEPIGEDACGAGAAPPLTEAREPTPAAAAATRESGGLHVDRNYDAQWERGSIGETQVG
jgi:hypothetical protein